MKHIQHNAEVAVKETLISIGTKLEQQTGGNSCIAIDYLDDGSPIKLNLYIDFVEGKAVCDFR